MHNPAAPILEDGAKLPSPSFIGYVETTIDALRLICAAEKGIIPRVTRRFSIPERGATIKSGTIFVFNVRETGIARWRDGMIWSPSRKKSNFLLYRELKKREGVPETNSTTQSRFVRMSAGDDPQNGVKEGNLMSGGLNKKTFVVRMEDFQWQLISYYNCADLMLGRLKRPITSPDIMSQAPISPSMFTLDKFRNPPKVEIGPDGEPSFVYAPEDCEQVPRESGEQLALSLQSTGTPVHRDSSMSGCTSDPRLEGGQETNPSNCSDTHSSMQSGRLQRSPYTPTTDMESAPATDLGWPQEVPTPNDASSDFMSDVIQTSQENVSVFDWSHDTWQSNTPEGAADMGIVSLLM